MIQFTLIYPTYIKQVFLRQTILSFNFIPISIYSFINTNAYNSVRRHSLTKYIFCKPLFCNSIETYISYIRKNLSINSSKCRAFIMHGRNQNRFIRSTQ